MTKPDSPKQLAIDILKRSICAVQVGACIEDSKGHIVSWGWNGMGAGYGLHAEAHAISRANINRLFGSTIYVASQRRRTNRDKPITSKPCEECQRLIDKWGLKVVWRDAKETWHAS